MRAGTGWRIVSADGLTTTDAVEAVEWTGAGTEVSVQTRQDNEWVTVGTVTSADALVDLVVAVGRAVHANISQVAATSKGGAV